MNRISQGSSGPDVARWQGILWPTVVGQGVRTDGIFGPTTAKWTRDWQTDHGLTPDGVVGDKTWGVALNGDTVQPPPMLPQPPAWLHPLSSAEREVVFGHFDWQPDPAVDGAITLLGTWARDSITRIEVPELVGKLGAAPHGAIFCHALLADPIRELFAAWRAEGLTGQVLSFAGCWAPRRIRGGQALSNHAWGTAFDINAPENGLGRPPAPLGSHGSVCALVPTAARLGWWWGGWFPVRPDGMHFEASAQLAERVRAL